MEKKAKCTDHINDVVLSFHSREQYIHVRNTCQIYVSLHMLQSFYPPIREALQ